jgi:hypothetical protein
MSKIGADRPANCRGASILVNFGRAVTIAGVLMATRTALRRILR